VTDTHTAIVEHRFIQVKSFHKRVLELVKITIKKRGNVMPGTGMFNESSNSSDSANNNNPNKPDPKRPSAWEAATTGALAGALFGAAVAGPVGGAFGAKAGATLAGLAAGAKFGAATGAGLGASKNLKDNGYETQSKVVGPAITVLSGAVQVSKAVETAKAQTKPAQS
jgi:hypothetical protein